MVLRSEGTAPDLVVVRQRESTGLAWAAVLLSAATGLGWAAVLGTERMGLGRSTGAIADPGSAGQAAVVVQVLGQVLLEV